MKKMPKLNETVFMKLPLGIEQAATYILPRRRLAHIDMNSQTTQMTTE
ncbi:hypothetical protein ALP86_102638 [Pseudomonas amygdali pv. mori]|uniref:Uncharacterized protein n=5 Tax=Pseudomonas syringae group TaxID=136849 RepID=A0A0P9W5L0_PSEA0|nr:hypothetical protein ALO50_102994 [Pseudomonas syringae pv. cerasicola]KPX18922.1 hypothetical protein ALO71_102488 [Pseudomonas amygdali pv. dendropanacis]KPX24055.1 hypothetical protein ALO70_102533 [Pseudomonas amygdali pv. eriobotryae]KPX98118.1 hypothetical protein ALO62_102985 [Pseudomonas amygdali pv. myricae]KPY06556.1 hypothetical protein ALO63_102732 [Pseudomonas amygdali pv. mori]KPY11047.1 hypothetical protein ALO61_102400 [Pseudomonas savastanoi pv. nerii]KPY47682.1 hypothetic